MNLLSIAIDLLAGWVVWSLSHNLGHRWWHVEMAEGKQTAYARGEREHHRLYDDHDDRTLRQAEDKAELFISFPFHVIAAIGLVFVGLYGFFRGWDHCWAFGAAMYASMIADHRLHILFHKAGRLPGVLGRLQEMHLIHHSSHRYNYFFVTGWLWDVLFGTARTEEKTEVRRQESAGAVGLSRL